MNDKYVEYDWTDPSIYNMPVIKNTNFIYKTENYPYPPEAAKVVKSIAEAAPDQILTQALLDEKEEKEDTRVTKIRPFNKIDQVGFEIEGAWLQEKELHDDASFTRADFPPNFVSVGEYVSKPHNNPNDLFKDIRENWPDTICLKTAYHIHVSLKNVALYSALMEKEFYDFFLKRVEEWAISYPYKGDDFWTRLRGKNRYARAHFIPDQQVQFKEKGHNRESRRTQLHYCYGQTKTLENRLFPSFKEAKTAISATKAYLNCIEDYLESHPLKEKLIDVVFTEQNELNLEEKTSGFNFFEDYDPDLNKDIKVYNEKQLKERQAVLDAQTEEIKKLKNVKERLTGCGFKHDMLKYVEPKPIKRRSFSGGHISKSSLNKSGIVMDGNFVVDSISLAKMSESKFEIKDGKVRQLKNEKIQTLEQIDKATLEKQLEEEEEAWEKQNQEEQRMQEMTKKINEEMLKETKLSIPSWDEELL